MHSSMLQAWHEFYTLIGTAAAALLALLFVAVSIGAGALSRDSAGPTRTYMSPVAFHFTAVLFLSALVLAPSETSTSLGMLLGLTAAAGFTYAGFVISRLMKDGIADLPDRLAYGATPLIAYAAIFAGAVMLLKGADRAAEVLAAGALMLLVVNVRNAWDLLLAMARRQSQSRGGAPPPP
jgi:hypothetical protein